MSSPSRAEAKTNLTRDPYRALRQAVDDRGDDKIDLGRAALTLALTDYPDLDIAAYLGRLDQLALEVSQNRERGGGAKQSLAALNYVLFERHGFRGNQENYYDPKNSFLNEVIERKQGIPITLSVLYMEIARRIGLVLEGVGFPGHFLVKHELEHGEVLIDPFDRGDVRTRDELGRMLDRLSGGITPLRSEFLQSASKRAILRRVLGNLKAIYSKDNQLVKLLAVLDQAIILEPGAAEEWRDRGMVHERLELFSQARADFESYLRLAPQAQDAPAVRDRLVNLAKQTTVIH